MTSSRAEVKEEYLAAAESVMSRLDDQVTLVPLRKACAAAEVPVASAYTIWGTQAEFDHDVAALVLLGSERFQTPNATFELVLRSLEAGDPLCEVVRRGVHENLTMLLGGGSLAAFVALLPSRSEARTRLLLSDHIEAYRPTIVQMYRMVLAKFDRKLRPGIDFDAMFLLLDSIVRGFAILQPLIGDKTRSIKGADWSLPAIAVWAVLEQILTGGPSESPFEVEARPEPTTLRAERWKLSTLGSSGKFQSPAERVLSAAAGMVHDELRERAEHNEPGPLADLSVRKVMVAAGRSPSTSLTPYFRNREHFLAELCARLLAGPADPVSKRRASAIADSDVPEARLIGELLRRDYGAFKKSRSRALVHQLWHGHASPALKRELTRAVNDRIERSAEHIKLVGRQIGRRMPKGFDESDLAVILMAVAEGLAIHEDLGTSMPSAHASIDHPYEGTALVIIELLSIPMEPVASS